jgi:hypothetical protein
LGFNPDIHNFSTRKRTVHSSEFDRNGIRRVKMSCKFDVRTLNSGMQSSALFCPLLWMGVSLSAVLTGCLDYEDCYQSDITCNPQAWFLYLSSASASEPPLCKGGSTTAFYGYYGGNGNDISNSVCAARDGGYITAGSVTNDVATLGGQSPLIPYQGTTEAMIVKLTGAGAVEWYSFAGSAAGTDRFTEVTETSDGGFVAVGNATAAIATLGGLAPIIPFQAANDWIVVRYSSSGAVEWWTFLGATAASLESAEGIVPTSDGGYIVTGLGNDMDGMPVASLNAFAGSNFDIVAVKLSSLGVVEWFRFFGSAVNEQGLDVISTADGNFVIAGLQLGAFTNNPTPAPILTYSGGQDSSVLKIDLQGNLMWQTVLGAAGNQTAVSVTESADGQLTVLMDATGAVAALGGVPVLTAYSFNDIYLARLTSAGEVVWHTFLATAGVAEAAGHAAALSDGGVLVAGDAFGNIPTLDGKTPLNPYSAVQDLLLVKMNSLGGVEWYTFVGGANNDNALGLTATRDGGFVVSGSSSSNLGAVGSLSPVNAFVNAAEFFILRGSSSGSF